MAVAGQKACGVCHQQMSEGDEWITLDGGEIWCAACWAERFGAGLTLAPTGAAPHAAPTEDPANWVPCESCGHMCLSSFDACPSCGGNPHKEPVTPCLGVPEEPAFSLAPGASRSAGVRTTVRREPQAGVPPVLGKDAPSGQVLLHEFLDPTINNYGAVRGVAWGILLLFGGLLPIVLPDPTGGLRTVFVNLEISNLPGVLQFLSLYPLVAGLAMIFLGVLGRATGRAIAFLAICAVYWVASMVAYSQAMGGISNLSQDSLIARIVGAQVASGVWVSFLLCLLAVAILIGLRIQRARPAAAFGRMLAAVAGAVFLLMLLLPVVPALVAPVAGSIPLAIPFNLMGWNGMVGLLALLTMAALVAVAVMACVSMKSTSNADLATTAIRILYGAMILLPLLGAVTGGYYVHEESKGTVAGPAAMILLPLLYALKFECLAYGLLAPLVLGTVELYASVPAWSANATPRLQQASGSRYLMEPMQAEAPSFLDAKQLRMGLEDLNNLKKAGLISELDYEAKKRELLERLRP